MKTRLLFTHALSPLHAGTGQGVGVIDLPIAREKSTGIPYLPGSSVKGVLRDQCTDNDTRQKVFGPDTTNGDAHASSVQFSDQRLLLLPIRSLAGTFAWVTSPYILRRFVREVQDVEVSGLPKDIPVPGDKETCLVAKQSEITLTIGNERKVCLEDIDLAIDQTQEGLAIKWAEWIAKQVFPNQKDWPKQYQEDWQKQLIARFCIVHDDVLSFLLNTATEVTARIKMKEDTKTVANGQLWYEEALPTETILSGLVLAAPTEKSGYTDEGVFDFVGKLMKKSLQFGGKATVGRGLCRMQMKEGA